MNSKHSQTGLADSNADEDHDDDDDDDDDDGYSIGLGSEVRLPEADCRWCNANWRHLADLCDD